MINGSSYNWYEMPCSYGTAINVFPVGIWFYVI